MATIEDVERLMLLMKEHRVDMVQVGEVKIVKAQHDAPALRPRAERERPDDDGYEEDLFGPRGH